MNRKYFLIKSVEIYVETISIARNSKVRILLGSNGAVYTVPDTSFKFSKIVVSPAL